MALEISDLNGSVLPPSGTDPYGYPLNAPSGTIADVAMMADMLVFFQKMMDEAAVTPNNLPDNSVNGFQLYEALIKTPDIFNTGTAVFPATITFSSNSTSIDTNPTPPTIQNIVLTNTNGRVGKTTKLVMKGNAAGTTIGISSSDTSPVIFGDTTGSIGAGSYVVAVFTYLGYDGTNTYYLSQITA